MKIEEFYQNTEKTTAYKLVVLRGMGGCGKSQLALDFCQRGHVDGRFTAIFWIDASSPNTVAQSYAIIAQAISKDQINSMDAEVNTHLVRTILGTWTAPWLLVFDNFDDPNAFSHHPLKSYFPQGQNGFILITSRHADSERLGYSIPVSTMLESEAMQLLFLSSKREQNDGNIAEGKKIIKRLGYLALAVDQAGAYIKGRIQFSAFLDHFEHRREEIMRKTPTVWDYHRKSNKAEAENSLSVATTWELSLDLLTADSPTALESIRHLLFLGAFFSRYNISEELFRASYESHMLPWTATFINEGSWDSYRYLDAVTELRNLSLIQESNNQAYDTSFSLHPLIQDWIKLRLSPQDRQAYTVESMQLLFHYMQSQVVHTTVQTRQTTISHVEVALENDRVYLGSDTQLGEYSLEGPTLAFAGVLNQHGRFKEAMMLYERLLEDREKRLSPNHPEILKILSYLANVHTNLGWIEKAEQEYNRVRTEREKWPGPEHIDTLGTMQNLAVIYAKQNRYEEAKQLVEKVRQGKEKFLSPEHPDALKAAHNLAIVYYQLGRYPDAILLNEKVLKARAEHLGEHDPLTLGTMQQLALAYNYQRRYEDAELLYQKALESLEEHFGWDYPDTMTVACNLADFYKQQSRYEDAQRLMYAIFHNRQCQDET
jgi:tetratricopeptide (TPR) repeat protein